MLCYFLHNQEQQIQSTWLVGSFLLCSKSIEIYTTGRGGYSTSTTEWLIYNVYLIRAAIWDIQITRTSLQTNSVQKKDVSEIYKFDIMNRVWKLLLPCNGSQKTILSKLLIIILLVVVYMQGRWHKRAILKAGSLMPPLPPPLQGKIHQLHSIYPVLPVGT